MGSSVFSPFDHNYCHNISIEIIDCFYLLQKVNPLTTWPTSFVNMPVGTSKFANLEANFFSQVEKL